jgi:hypothetical protein
MTDVHAHVVLDESGQPVILDQLCERVTLHVRDLGCCCLQLCDL